MKNSIPTVPEEPFTVGVSDLSFFNNRSTHTDNGAILFCCEGSAKATVGQYTGTIRNHTLVMLLPDTSISIDDRTDDFRMDYCTFTHDLFIEIVGRFDPAFFRILQEQPMFDLPETLGEGMKYWFRIVASTYRDRENIFRNIIIRNWLQNLFLEAYDKVQRYSTQFRHQQENEISTRQNELLRRFVSLVKEHCASERSVAFYADKLCISTRYLAAIIHNTKQVSVKSLIDRAVVLEIKSRLQSTDLSVQEIAYLLHFPDQSYLGRFFKKHTGQSPSAFRNSWK